MPRLNKRNRFRFYRKIRTTTRGHWVWMGVKSKNRPHGCFRVKGGYVSPHAVAWMLEYKRRIPRNRLLVAACGVRECCRPEHQQLMTKGQLISNSNRGVANRNNRLTLEQVLRIKTSREPSGVLAKEISVSRALISAIKKGLAWGWVEI